MWFLPYIVETMPLSLEESDIEDKIRGSKLTGWFDRYGQLKLERKSWIINAFRPVALCHLNSGSPENQITVIIRPNLTGFLFSGVFIFSLFFVLIDALFHGVLIGAAGAFLLMFAPYAMLLLGFWLEVPALKKELRKLFQ